MKLRDLSDRLDEIFNIKTHTENLIEWAVTDGNKEFCRKEFLEGKSALMFAGSQKVEKVYTSVFVTKPVIKKLSLKKNALLFTHHNFDYFEDPRGLQPIEPSVFLSLRESHNSLYVAHAPLDTHPRYGTSVSLAEVFSINIEKYFYDYFGAPTALVGKIEKTDTDDFAEMVKNKLERPAITCIKHKPFAEKIAVVAGGGDMPDILQAAYALGCDTLLSGTIENKWNIPYVQKLNSDFHKLNETLKLNLIGATHYGTERPAMLKVVKLFENLGIEAEYMEDEILLNAL